MYIEINDPTHCTFIHQQPGAQLHPSEEQSRQCPQCQQGTWAHTSTCMWCGYNRWALPTKVAGVALTLIMVGLLLWRMP